MKKWGLFFERKRCTILLNFKILLIFQKFYFKGMEETQKNLNFILLVVTTPAQPVAFPKHLPRDAPCMGRRSWRVCTLPGFSSPSVASLSAAPAEITWTRVAWQVLSPIHPWRSLFFSIPTHGLKNRTWVFLWGWLPLQNQHLAQVKGRRGCFSDSESRVKSWQSWVRFLKCF